MKRFLFVIMVVSSTAAFAQPKVISQATITTTTNVVAPEEDELQNVQNQGQGQGGPGAMFRNFGDGETKATTYLKNDMVKTIVKTDLGRTTIIRNNGTKITTTLLEIMGNKTGFYASDEDQAAMRKKMDSIMQARRAADTGAAKKSRPAGSENNTEVHYTSETKKIAGYTCKKAFLVTTHILGIKDSSAVWYNPDFKLQNLNSTGGTMGFTANNAFDKVDGFIMGYESKLPRGRVMTVEVTKIDVSKEIADKEFDIPKDFELKPISEMGNMFGGRGGGNIQIHRQ